MPSCSLQASDGACPGLPHCWQGHDLIGFCAGEIQGFWMPKIKDRAYLIYATEEEAEATRNAVSGIEWPTGNANSLRPK